MIDKIVDILDALGFFPRASYLKLSTVGISRLAISPLVEKKGLKSLIYNQEYQDIQESMSIASMISVAALNIL